MAISVKGYVNTDLEESARRSPSLRYFISQIKGEGLSRTNRFTVDIGQPNGLPPDTGTGRLALLYCEQAALPGMAYGTTPVRSFGENREIVYERNFETITLSFFVDTKMRILGLFNDWMNLIIDPNTRTIGFYDDYITTMSVTIQDIGDGTTYVMKFFEVYPKSIAPIQLDYNSKDVAKLSVTFNYKYHVGSVVGTSQTEANLPYTVDVLETLQNRPIDFGAGGSWDDNDTTTGDSSVYTTDGIDVPIDYSL